MVMDSNSEVKTSVELKPCPFCGGDDFIFVENDRIWMGTKWGKPVSVSIRHHCKKILDQPTQRVIERVGKDRESVIQIWNMRFKPF